MCTCCKMYTKYKVCLGGALFSRILCSCTRMSSQVPMCECVLECSAPSSKQERSTVNSITTLSPHTERWPDQRNFNCEPIWSCPELFSEWNPTQRLISWHFLQICGLQSTWQKTWKFSNQSLYNHLSATYKICEPGNRKQKEHTVAGRTSQ